MRNKIENNPCYFFGDKNLGYKTDGYQYEIEIDDEKDFLICELFLRKESLKQTT